MSLNDEIVAAVVEQVKVANDAVFSQIRSGLDVQMRDLRKRIQEDHVVVAEMAAKKAKLDKSFDFKSKGNEDQYLFNNRVADSIEKAGASVGTLES